jgi:hypothetical protein
LALALYCAVGFILRRVNIWKSYLQ